MTDLINALLPENVFLRVFDGHTSILSDTYFNNSTDISRNHFCGIFLNSHEYFQEITQQTFVLKTSYVFVFRRRLDQNKYIHSP